MTTTNSALVNQIRDAIDEAHRQGRHRPGRPALVELTGATDYEIRKALAQLVNEQLRQPLGQPELADLAGVSDCQVRHAWTGQANEDTSDSQLLGNPRDHDGGSPTSTTDPANNRPRADEGVSIAGDQPGESHPDPTGGDLHRDARPTVTQLATTGAGSNASTAASSTSPNGPRPERGAPGGRLVAWAGFVFGSATSIAANVLHAWLPAAHEPPGWTPGLPPQIGATVWPIGLMLAVEALSRIKWPRGFGWAVARYGGAGAVALGSAVISYGHLRNVLLAWQYGPLAAAVGPLVLDGLMVVCGFALLANSLANAGDTTTTDQ